LVTAWLGWRAGVAATPFEATSFTMLATLMALAVAEHWFLVVPLNANALWGPMSRRHGVDPSALLEGEPSTLATLRVAAATDRGQNWSAPALSSARNKTERLEKTKPDLGREGS
jgi:hypothetical protein